MLNLNLQFIILYIPLFCKWDNVNYLTLYEAIFRYFYMKYRNFLSYLLKI